MCRRHGTFQWERERRGGRERSNDLPDVPRTVKEDCLSEYIEIKWGRGHVIAQYNSLQNTTKNALVHSCVTAVTASTQLRFNAQQRRPLQDDATRNLPCRNLQLGRATTVEKACDPNSHLSWNNKPRRSQDSKNSRGKAWRYRLRREQRLDRQEGWSQGRLCQRGDQQRCFGRRPRG